MSPIFKKWPSDWIDVGDFIGTVGSTGNASNNVSHLHLEILDENDNPQDSYERLSSNFTLKDEVSFLGDVFRDI